MKTNSKMFALAAAGLLAVSAAFNSAQAQALIKYEGKSDSKMTLDGDSTVHRWSVECRLYTGTMEVDSAFDADLKTLKTQPKVEISVPVRQLKSGKTKMDNVMYETMHHKENPKITFKLKSLTPKAGGGAGEFDSKGDLTVNGVTQEVSMPVKFERVDAKTLKVTGSTVVKMSSFKMEPPTLIGVLSTKDEVTVKFDWQAEKTEAAK